MGKGLPSYTDEELLAGIRHGDDRALAHMYRQYLPTVIHLVTQNSGTEDEAKDIYQEGVMVFYEKVREGTLELSCQIKTYLYAVCRRLWLKRLAEKGRYGGRLADHEPYLETGAEADLADAEERDRQFALMSEALTRLGEPCRSLLEGFYLLDKSMQQLTAEHGYTNADNAKNQKYKCLVRLKKLFFTQYKEEPLP